MKISSKPYKSFLKSIYCQLNWAEILIYDTLSNLFDPTSPLVKARMPWFEAEIRSKLLDNAPLLKKLMKKVENQPGIKKWLRERPPNDQEPF